MASKRDKLKQLNKIREEKAADKTTIVDELVEQYEKEAESSNNAETGSNKEATSVIPEKKSTLIMNEPVTTTREESVVQDPSNAAKSGPIVEGKKTSNGERSTVADEDEQSPRLAEIKETPLINVIDKSRVGRPKVLEGVYKPISARLKQENYEHARIVGGKYGGMNAYLNWLIEQDMKKSEQ